MKLREKQLADSLPLKARDGDHLLFSRAQCVVTAAHMA